MSLPILSIELAEIDTFNRTRIETPHVYAVAVGIGARHVKGFDAARVAK